MECVDRMLQHRSIREFKKDKLNEEQKRILLDVAQRTASSTGMQSYSIIHLTDEHKKALLAEICNQEYVARMPDIFIFIADVYRNSRIARENGVITEAEGDSDRFFQGWTDAAIAAQNMVNAAELMGLGTVFLGSIWNDMRAVIRLLELPLLTVPVVGVGLGIPNQDPELKPRLPRKNIVFENSYRKFASYMSELAEYDEEMKRYYDIRSTNHRLDSFTRQVVKRLKNPLPKRQELFEIIEKQGFKLKTDK